MWRVPGRLPARDRLRAPRPGAEARGLPRGAVGGSRGMWRVPEAYQQAIDSGHADAAPRPINLGLLLEEQGDLPGATAAYQRAIDSGHLMWRRWPRSTWGCCWKSRGMWRVPRPPTSGRSTPGTRDVAALAAVELGVLLEEQGDVAGAKAAYQGAIDSGHADVAPLAAVNLGALLEAGGCGGAEAAYQRAIDSGHADAAPMAAVNLGVLLERQGDVVGAKAAYQQAIDSGHPDAGAEGRGLPGSPAAGAGGCGGCPGRFQRAIDSGHPDCAASAAANLRLLQEHVDAIDDIGQHIGDSSRSVVCRVLGWMPWPQRVGQLLGEGRPGDQLSLATARTITSYYLGSVDFITATVAGAAGILAQAVASPTGTRGTRFFIATNQEGEEVPTLRGRVLRHPGSWQPGAVSAGRIPAVSCSLGERAPVRRREPGLPPDDGCHPAGHGRWHSTCDSAPWAKSCSLFLAMGARPIQERQIRRLLRPRSRPSDPSSAETKTGVPGRRRQLCCRQVAGIGWLRSVTESASAAPAPWNGSWNEYQRHSCALVLSEHPRRDIRAGGAFLRRSGPLLIRGFAPRADS